MGLLMHTWSNQIITAIKCITQMQFVNYKKLYIMNNLHIYCDMFYPLEAFGSNVTALSTFFGRLNEGPNIHLKG